MTLVVIYDACVLYPAALRDLLMRVAQAGLVRARWTDAILDECFENIVAARPELSPEALARTRELMIEAVRDCLVTRSNAQSPQRTRAKPFASAYYAPRGFAVLMWSKSAACSPQVAEDTSILQLSRPATVTRTAGSFPVLTR